MKIRQGFVSNSSSSSFIIQKQGLTKQQLCIIKNFKIKAKKSSFDWKFDVDNWSQLDHEEYYEFYTMMDNFDLAEFFESYGISISDTFTEK